MDFLTGLMTGQLQAGTPGPTDDFWYGPAGTVTAAGLRIDSDGAQKVSAWYRGRDILATSLAMLPLGMYQRRGPEEAPDHPLHDVLHRKPNPWQDSFQSRREAMFHIIDHGHAYYHIVPGPRGFADQLWPIHPTLVTPELLDSGVMRYVVRDPKRGTTRVLTQDDIFHLRGAEGKGVLEHARDSLGLGLVLENYASKLFSRGALGGGFIQVPGPADADARKALAKSYLTPVGDWHVPKILENGATFQASTMEPEKAQFILSRKFSVNDIARWLGLPPHMLADLERSTNNNIEHQGQEFVTYSLGLWLSLWEFSINDQLVLRPQTYYAEFKREALVRGDIATRWAAYVSGTNAGILAVNEVRKKENLPAVDGGDVPRPPANIVGNRRAADGQPPPRRNQDDDNNRAEAIAAAAAARLLRKEVRAVQRLAVKHAADEDAFAAAVTEFYAKHVTLVMNELKMSQVDAESYCSQQAVQALSDEWVWLLEQWNTEAYAAGLAALAVEEAES